MRMQRFRCTLMPCFSDCPTFFFIFFKEALVNLHVRGQTLVGIAVHIENTTFVLCQVVDSFAKSVELAYLRLIAAWFHDILHRVIEVRHDVLCQLL